MTVTTDRDSHSASSGTESTAVQKRLEAFEVIGNRYFRSLVKFAPMFLVLMLIFDLLFGLDFLMGGNTFMRDKFRLTFAVVMLLELAVIKRVFADYPDTLFLCWTRTIAIRHEGDQSNEVETRFIRFLEEIEGLLNSRLFSLISGLIVALAALLATYPFVYFKIAKRFPEAGISPFVYVEVFFAFVFGLIVWRYVMIAISVGKLAGEPLTFIFRRNIVTNAED